MVGWRRFIYFFIFLGSGEADPHGGRAWWIKGVDLTVLRRQREINSRGPGIRYP